MACLLFLTFHFQILSRLLRQNTWPFILTSCWQQWIFTHLKKTTNVTTTHYPLCKHPVWESHISLITLQNIDLLFHSIQFTWASTNRFKWCTSFLLIHYVLIFSSLSLFPIQWQYMQIHHQAISKWGISLDKTLHLLQALFSSVVQRTWFLLPRHGTEYCIEMVWVDEGGFNTDEHWA